jgi:hypothetical protein
VKLELELVLAGNCKRSWEIQRSKDEIDRGFVLWCEAEGIEVEEEREKSEEQSQDREILSA